MTKLICAIISIRGNRARAGVDSFTLRLRNESDRHGVTHASPARFAGLTAAAVGNSCRVGRRIHSRTADQLGRTFLIAAVWLAGALIVPADTHYVSLSGTNDSAGGYTNWAGAATQIQWAVDAAGASDIVLVSNGTYYLTNQIVVTNSITLQSVNGRDYTFINGNYPAYSNRCLLLSNNAAIVDGFTISNGYIIGSGGGILTYGSTVQNCHIRNNFSSGSGGGVNMVDLMPVWTTQKLLNCIINSNCGVYAGGVIQSGYYALGMISNCVISCNTATAAGYAGGLHLCGLRMYDSEISYNTGSIGGVRAGWYGGIFGCKIIGNNGTTCGGINLDIGYYLNNGGLHNCLIYANRTTTGAGGVAIPRTPYVGYQYLRNLTIVSNSTASSTNAGGIYFYGATGQTTNVLYNSIVYYNTAGGANSNVYNDGMTNIIVRNCCIGMTNGAFSPSTDTNNVIYADPLLLDLPAGNCRLGSKSPCINAGYYESWMATGVDLDNRIRIRYGTVDLGAYEFIRSGAVYGFH
ncbi:MAG: hypothetical protein ABIH24_04195 [Verrucomicrobiota bacterium]